MALTRRHHEICTAKTDEVIEPASEVDSVADEIEKEVDLVWSPADDVSAAYKERRDNSVPSYRSRSRLNNN